MLQAGHHPDRRACARGTRAQCPWAEAGPCAAGASRSDSRAVSPPQVGSLARPDVQKQPFPRREPRPVSISRLLDGANASPALRPTPPTVPCGSSVKLRRLLGLALSLRGVAPQPLAF